MCSAKLASFGAGIATWAPSGPASDLVAVVALGPDSTGLRLRGQL
jgi:hypothetical protein